MLCEMCGKDVPRLKRISVEGTLLMVCEGCSRFGQETSTPARSEQEVLTGTAITSRLEARRRRFAPKDVYEQAGDEDLLPDYPEKIRGAREARGWKQEDLGKRINERVSIIEKLEKGEIRPSDELVERLERALDLRLRGKVQTASTPRSSGKKPLTLGDLIGRD